MATGSLSATGILAILEESGALLDGHFRLSSGLHSPRYLQCAVALQHPEIAARLGTALARSWQEIAATPPAATVVSPALGGVIIGHEVARALRLRACFTERVDGEMTLRRGFALQTAEPVLVVEDVVTTGKSTCETLHVVRELEAHPVGVACIANRSGGSSLAGLSLVSLIELDIPTFAAEECPNCAAGEPVIKPGSRPV